MVMKTKLHLFAWTMSWRDLFSKAYIRLRSLEERIWKKEKNPFRRKKKPGSIKPRKVWL